MKRCRKKSVLQLLKMEFFHVSSLNLLLYSFLVVDNWMGKEISQKTEEKEESTVPGKNRFSTNVCWINEWKGTLKILKQSWCKISAPGMKFN